MPIFSKPNAIVYVRRNGLIVAGKKMTPARMTFAPEQIENLEIVDDAAFGSGLVKFFGQHSLKGKHVLMVLDDSIVFTKQIAIDSSGTPRALAEAFIEAMPLSPGKRACLRVSSADALSLYASNGDLYIAIADALDQAGVARVLAITPATAYAAAAGKQPLAAAVQQYINDTSVRSTANFQHAALI